MKFKLFKWTITILTDDEIQKNEEKFNWYTYQEILNYYCDEYGVPGSPNMTEAIEHIRDRNLRRKDR